MRFIPLWLGALTTLTLQSGFAVAESPSADQPAPVGNAAAASDAREADRPAGASSDQIVNMSVQLFMLPPDELDSFFLTLQNLKETDRRAGSNKSTIVLSDANPPRKIASAQVLHAPRAINAKVLDRMTSEARIEPRPLRSATTWLETKSGRPINLDFLTFGLDLLDGERLGLDVGWQDSSVVNEPARRGQAHVDLKIGEAVVFGMKYNRSHCLVIVRPKLGGAHADKRS